MTAANTPVVLATAETIRCSRSNDRQSPTVEVRRERVRTEIRESTRRRGQDRCSSRTDAAVSADPLPLGLAHPEEFRAGQDDALRLLLSGTEYAPMDLSILGRGKQMGKCDKKGKGSGGKNGKGKGNAQVTEYLAGCCNECTAGGHMKKDCWWNATSQERERYRQPTCVLDVRNVVAINSGCLAATDTSNLMFSVSNREASENEFLVGFEAATSVCQQRLSDSLVNSAELGWRSDQPLDTNSPRRTIP